MSADPRTEAAAKACFNHDWLDADWETHKDERERELYRADARRGLAAADAAALADVRLHARITAWIGRHYPDERPSPRQVRMVLAALTALNKEQQ